MSPDIPVSVKTCIKAFDLLLDGEKRSVHLPSLKQRTATSLEATALADAGPVGSPRQYRCHYYNQSRQAKYRKSGTGTPTAVMASSDSIVSSSAIPVPTQQETN